jgi:hypothetical protein
MNETVAQVRLGTSKRAVTLTFTPQSCGADFIDGRHRRYSAARLNLAHNLEYIGQRYIYERIEFSWIDVMQPTEEFLIETADRCKRLARAGRELAAGLETMGNDLMAKAVEFDTTRQKTERSAGTAD